METAALDKKTDSKLKKKLDAVAKGAVRWLLASRSADGRIPYVLLVLLVLLVLVLVLVLMLVVVVVVVVVVRLLPPPLLLY